MATKDQSEFKYLVANDRDRLWGITVTSVGFQRIDADEAYPPADHPAGYYFNVTAGRVLDEYQLIYVVDGEGVFESDGKTYALAPGAMFLIFPGCWHTYRPNRKTGWSVYWIGFRGKVVDERVAGGFFSGRSPVYNVGISTLAIDVYRGAMQAAGQEGPYYQQMLSGAVSLLMGVALNLNSGRKSPNDETCDKIARAKVIMRDNLSENISAQEVARRLHVSYSWFRTAFKRHAGMAPAQYILELKLFRAMELLSDPAMTVKEVSYALDFNSSRYFSSFFHKRTGYSPQEYRCRLRGSEATDDPLD